MPKQILTSKWGAWILILLTTMLIGCGSNQDGMDEIFITTNSDQARHLFNEALATFEKIRFTEAREMFSKAIEVDPGFAMAHYYRAITSSTAGEFNEHIQKAKELSSSVTEGERLMIEASYAALVENNPTRGIEILQQLAETFPKDKRVHATLGNLYYGQDEDDKAIQAFRKAIEIDPDYSTAYNSLGYAYREKGDFEKAEEAFKNYIRLLPDEANPHDSIADLYTRMGKHEDAIRHYEKAAELNPKFAVSQRKIGMNLIYMGKFEEARQAFDKAITMESTVAGKLSDLDRVANSYLYEGKLNQAQRACEDIITLASQEGIPEWQATGHATRCQVFLAMGDLENAEASMAECRNVVMTSDLMQSIKESFIKDALFNEAIIAAKRGDFDAAWQKADEHKTRISAGNNPKEMEDHHALLGRLYLERGETGEAIEHLKQADMENPYTVFELASAYASTGDEEKATQLYRDVAGWNQHSVDYALVRSHAIEEVNRRVAAK
ncbi:MAG: tetratricopeptide repeat protein [bacterium]